MRILLTGATGFVGGALAQLLRSKTHEVRSVSRGAGGDHDWSDASLEAGVEWCEAVVHLAGENLFGKRWSAATKERLRQSRTDTTRRLAELCARHAPRTFLSASAVGYYGPSEQQGLTESSPAGDDFLARLCVDWEAAQAPAHEADVRCLTLRIGVVLGAGGGALQKMLLPFRLGVGGRVGSGRQWFPWVHLDDLVALIAHLLEHEECAGIYNATAPQPVTNADFTRAMGRVLRRPTLLPAPGFALKLALGEVADVLLTGQHVLPARALESGFEFAHPEIEGALRATL